MKVNIAPAGINKTLNDSEILFRDTESFSHREKIRQIICMIINPSGQAESIRNLTVSGYIENPENLDELRISIKNKAAEMKNKNISDGENNFLLFLQKTAAAHPKHIPPNKPLHR